MWVECTSIVQKHLRETSRDNDVFIPFIFNRCMTVCGTPTGLFGFFTKEKTTEKMTAHCSMRVFSGKHMLL